MMKATFSVLAAVASELTNTAKSKLPKIKEGEKVIHEWVEGGKYCRETEFNGETILAQYDFKRKIATAEKRCMKPLK